jgi:putative intracellular protease/amidase
MNAEILVFDGVEALDVFGPLSALAGAGFEVALVADGGPRQVRTVHGTGLAAREPGAAPGVLVVPGGGWISRSERGCWTGGRPSPATGPSPSCPPQEPG